MAAPKLIAFFNEIDKHDLPLVGGKTANLGEMVKAKLPVPDGFAVTVPSYQIFLNENKLQGFLDDALKGLDVHNADELRRVAKHIQRKITSSKMPKIVAEETREAYKKLVKQTRVKLVAVRSSATAEDLPTASFAGQQATFLNIKGDNSLLESVKACWASLYTARAIFYRVENKIKHEKVGISVIVQQMVQSDVSGVMFSIDPVTNQKDRVVIEAVWGLGELIVQGSVLPDRYVVQKDTFSVLSKEISDQTIELVKKGSKTIEQKVNQKKRDIQKITNDDIVALAHYAVKLQEHYYFPQDIEWAKAGNSLYIVQTRPVTTVKRTTQTKTETGDIKTAQTPILEGAPASPGIGVGMVKILKGPKEIGKVKQGDILVAKMTSPDYVPAMKKATAIVTDKGGMTSHAAIVSRELGIPCIVGTKTATSSLSENTVITVDGEKGLIYLGSTMKVIKHKPIKEKIIKTKTATKLYVNLAEEDLAKKTSKKHVDGIGLLRAEFMIADIGIHPKEAIKNKKQDQFTKKLYKGINEFCKNFNPRPVVYRATDFKTNEYRSLEGGKAWEPEEANPMLGFRGAYRYIANPDVFNLELQAIKMVREKYKNLWLMIPFVRSPEELKKVKRIIASEGLFDSPTFKLWMMVELPVNVIMLEDFIKVGIDGVSVGSNDLTMLLLGTDRDNEEVAPAFDERSEVVKWALKRIIRICNKHGISSSICGQAPSTYEDLVENLVKWGITSISVNPDAINRVRGVIADKEKELIM